MVEMGYAQVRLPRFLVKNEKRQPPQEEMSNLEATMAELRKSQAQFMEEVHTPPQEESNVKNGGDELAFVMVELAKTMAEMPKEEASFNIQIQPIPLKLLKREMTPKATSYTQHRLEKEQPLQEKGMSIQELVSKHMNEGENIAKMSFEGQHKSLPSILEVIREEEDLSYNKDITSRNNEELDKLTKGDDDAKDLKAFVVMEDELTSPESHDTIKDEVLKTIPEMDLWGDMHEELKIEEVTPMSKVEECIFKLNKEMEATIVKQKEENLKNMIVNDYVLKLLLEHNY